jgi:apolipoprotein N-acyltransferase
MPGHLRLPPLLAAAALALFGGFLVALALPPWGFWPLAFVGVMCFELALGEFPTPGQRATRGFAFGVAWLSMGMGWMWFLTAPGYIIAVCLFAGLHALAALAAPSGPWRVIGRPLAHTLAEAVRLVVPFGGVPLATLPIGQAGGPLLGTVRLGGVILLTWVVFQIGFALAGPSPYVPSMARRRRGGARPQFHGLAGLVAVAVVVVLVALVAPTGAPGSGAADLRVAVVQGGGEQGTRAIDSDPREVFERHLEVTQQIEPGDAEMVLWPENVIDVAVFADSVEFQEVAAEAARLDAPMVVGITEDVVVDGESTRFLNAQVVVSPEGEIVSRYDKVQRVPFGEYMPMRSLLDALGAPTDLVPKDAVAGTEPAVLDLPDGTRLAVVISWEVFFGDRARDGVVNGGTFIANPTNGSSYTGTVLQTQQVASSRLRAVENGRWVAQAAPTGFSAFISPSGDVQQRTGVSEQALIVGDVALGEGRTWYSRLGDWPFGLAALVMLVVCWVMARPRSAPSPDRR